MRKMARIVGLVWMAAALTAGIILMGGGFMQGRSLPVYLAFGAATPGIALYRWARGLDVFPARQARQIPPVPLKMTDTGHELKLDTVPKGPDGGPFTPAGPSAIPPRL